MKYLPFILGNILRRSKLRNVLTILVVMLAILLISILSGILAAFEAGVEVADAQQLITRNKVSLIFPLPISYRDKISAVAGVEQVAGANWFQGVYKDPANFFPRVAIEAERFLEINPRYKLDPQERGEFLRDRGGALIGAGIARRFNLKIGDPIELEGDIYPGQWSFTIRAIYDIERAADDDTWMFFHWEYLNERMKEERPEAADHAGWYVLKIDDPGRAPEIAKTVDGLFENSPHQTHTETEAAFQQGFLKMMGDIETILLLIGGAVFIAMLLVAINTMMMSAAERTTEIGVLKAMGYSGGSMIGLILAESVTIASVGAVLGTAASLGLAKLMRPALAAFFPAFYVPVSAQILGIVAGVAIGLFSGLIPAFLASRLHPVKALRGIH